MTLRYLASVMVVLVVSSVVLSLIETQTGANACMISTGSVRCTASSSCSEPPRTFLGFYFALVSNVVMLCFGILVCSPARFHGVG